MSRIVLARIAGTTAIAPAAPNGTVGEYYNWQPAITGDARPYALAFPTLPAGLSLVLTGDDDRTRAYRISGTPTAAGDYPIAIVATGSDRVPVTFTFTINIAALPIILAGSFVALGAGLSITGSLTATGGTGPYTLIRVDSGISGITFSMASGVITASGTVIAAATYYPKFIIADSAGQVATITVRIKAGTQTTYFYIAPNGDQYTSPSGDSYTSPPLED